MRRDLILGYSIYVILLFAFSHSHCTQAQTARKDTTLDQKVRAFLESNALTVPAPI